MTPKERKEIDTKALDAFYKQFESFLIDQKNIEIFLAFLASVGLTVTVGNDNMVFPIITGATGYASLSAFIEAVRDAQRFKYDYERQLVRETDDYKYCVELYDSVITDLTCFIKSLGLRDSLDIGMFYQELLYGGILSATGRFNLHGYDFDLGICSEIYGARVSSGKGVCRHVASNLKDLYEKMGFTASYLAVAGTKSTFLNNIRTRIMPSTINHAVVCVKDCYGKYIIDPTWDEVAIFDNGENFAHIIGDKTEERKYVIGYSTLINYRELGSYEGYVGIRKAQTANLVNEDIEAARRKAQYLFDNNWSLIRKFYETIKERLEKVAYYEKEIARYRNKKKKTLIKTLKR